MKKSTFILLIFFICTFSSNAQTRNPVIVIETNLGTMRAVLFDDTPLHRDHYLNLIRRGHFDGTLFTRVINEFMIQGGSTDSRNAPPGFRVGAGRTDMDIPNEARPHHFHRKGAIAAPRRTENNPHGVSDGSQFFIVQGTPMSHGHLDTLEMVVNIPIRNAIIRDHHHPYREEFARLRDAGMAVRFNALLDSLNFVVDSLFNNSPDTFFFTEEFRNAYVPHGGAQHLDGDYTVFGQVIEGLSVIDRIARQPVDGNHRPREDVRIIRMFVEE